MKTALCENTGLGRRCLEEKMELLKAEARTARSARLPEGQEAKVPTFTWRGQGYRQPIQIRDGEPTPYGGLTNWTVAPTPSGRGRDDGGAVPLRVMEIVAQLYNTIGDSAIINVGGELCYHYQDDVTVVRDQADLLAISGEAFAEPTSWRDRGEYVSKGEFHAAARRHAPRFESLLSFPQYPQRPSTFYYGAASASLPEATGDALLALLEFYSPATELDRHLLAALFAAPFWGHWASPIFIVDSVSGRNAGKTSIPFHLAHLLGQTPLEVSNHHGIDGERLRRRLVVGEGKRRTIILIDNIAGVLESPDLAALVTSPVVSALPNHGREECRRAHDFVIVATMNDSVADPDIADRSFFLYVKHPQQRDSGWDSQVRRFIDDRRQQIWADILGLLRCTPAYTPTGGNTRFGAFESAVLAAVCPSQEAFDAAVTLTISRQHESDRDVDSVAEVGQAIDNSVRTLLAERRLTFDAAVVGIANGLLLRLYRTATGDNHATQQRASKVLRRAISAGNLPRLEVPPDGKLDPQTRGLVWRGPAASSDHRCDLILNLDDGGTDDLLAQTATEGCAEAGSPETIEPNALLENTRGQQDRARTPRAMMPSECN